MTFTVLTKLETYIFLYLKLINNMKEISVTITGIELDFETAGKIASIIASKIDKNSMLLAWYDARKGDLCPNVCCDEDEPNWHVEVREGTIKIKVNSVYEFIYTAPTTLVVQNQ